jgi:hypothetical protein
MADINLTIISALFVGVSFREANLVKNQFGFFSLRRSAKELFLQSCRERSQKSITQTRFTCAIEFFFLKSKMCEEGVVKRSLDDYD